MIACCPMHSRLTRAAVACVAVASICRISSKICGQRAQHMKRSFYTARCGGVRGSYHGQNVGRL